MSPLLVSAIVQICADAPKSAIQEACSRLDAAETDATTALGKLTGVFAKESLVLLRQCLGSTATTSRELSLALACAVAGIDTGKAAPDIQLVWTGPHTPEASPRDTLPQMLEMIGRAESRILLVTFAAFKSAHIMESLESAAARGVEMMIVVESTDGSAGQLSRDALKAFPKPLTRTGCIWHWPNAKRPRNARGMPGKLHAKCLVIDRHEVLISSANLTDDAMMRNVEVGVRCSNGRLAAEIEAKFDGMAKMGYLERVFAS